MKLYAYIRRWLIGRIPESYIEDSEHHKSQIEKVKKGTELATYEKAEIIFNEQLKTRMNLAEQVIKSIRNEKTTLEEKLIWLGESNERLQSRNNELEHGLKQQREEYDLLVKEYREQVGSLRELLQIPRVTTALVYQKLKLVCKQLPESKEKPMLFVGPNGWIEDFNDAAKNKIRNYEGLIGKDYDGFIQTNIIKSFRSVYKPTKQNWVEISKVIYEARGIEFQTEKSGVILLNKITSVHKYLMGITRKNILEALKGRKIMNPEEGIQPT